MPLWEYIPLYTDLFVSRSDDYAMQLSSGRYRRVGKPLEALDLFDHLMGVRSYGVYVQDQQGTCRFAVVDADTDDGLSMLVRVQAALRARGIASYLEASRRGAHLWIFFKEPAFASWVRAWLLPFVPSSVEFYPKQDETTGYGSLIRLPLGVHRRSGKRYPWLTPWSEESGPVLAASTVEGTLDWLRAVEKVTVPAPTAPRPDPTHDRTQRATAHATHPSITQPDPTHTRTTHILEWCCAQDPIALIGRYVKLSPQGLGHCPFHDHHQGADRHPSFKVYQPSRPGGCCWYCYVWGKGGNAFNFLQYYYQLDARTLWHKLCAGAVL